MPDRKDSESGQANQKQPGRISHDARGNAVWQWAGDTARNALESTSRMLKKLEVSGLRLLDDPEPGDAKSEDPLETLKAKRASGFNPYEGSSAGMTRPPASTAAKPPAKAAFRKAAPVQPAAPRPKPSLWSRLLGKGRQR